MPKPYPNEKKKDYIARCMSDDKAKQERPDSLARLVYCTKIYETEKMQSFAESYTDYPQKASENLNK